MKGLTICQPYAELIIRGEKRVENRTWSTSYRGWLAIHAGKSREWLSPGDEERYPDMAFGAVIGFARLAACAPIWDLRSAAKEANVDFVSLAGHEHAEGPICWVLQDVRRLPGPVPMVGRQRLFNLPPYHAREWFAWLDQQPVAV